MPTRVFKRTVQPASFRRKRVKRLVNKQVNKQVVRQVKRQANSMAMRALINNNQGIRRAQIQTNANYKAAQRGRTKVKMNAQQRRTAIMPYIHCRLTPWSGAGSQGIPDGSDTRRVVIDHRFISTFTFGSTGSFYVGVIPAFPTCVIAQVPNSDSTALINGFAPTANRGTSSVYFPAGILPEWSAIPITFNNLEGTFDNYVPYLSATKARVVTIAFRVIYTGSTINNSGWLVVNRDAIDFGIATPNLATYVVYGNTSSNQNYSQGQVLNTTCNYSPTNIVTSSSMTVGSSAYDDRLEYGCYSVLKHSGDTYRWVDVFNNVNYIDSPLGTDSSLITENANATAETFARLNPCAFYDADWNAMSLNFSGGYPGQTFNIETIVCVEYIPSSSSAMYQMARNAPDHRNQLQAVDKISKELPTASASTGAFTKAVTAATGLAASIIPAIL